MENTTNNIETIDMTANDEGTYTSENPGTDTNTEDDKQQPKTSVFGKARTFCKNLGWKKIAGGTVILVVAIVGGRKVVKAVKAAITPASASIATNPINNAAQQIVDSIPDNLAEVAPDLDEIGAAAETASQTVTAQEVIQNVAETVEQTV